MSERIQENAKDRARAAHQRAQRARKRASANEQRGNEELARLHRQSAELQADAASDAETLLELDQQIEGDQLGQ
ncbi:MAG: hypothetical protein ACTHQQ_10935 [Solirubrobacteraceae bacterium]